MGRHSHHEIDVLWAKLISKTWLREFTACNLRIRAPLPASRSPTHCKVTIEASLASPARIQDHAAKCRGSGGHLVEVCTHLLWLAAFAAAGVGRLRLWLPKRPRLCTSCIAQSRTLRLPGGWMPHVLDLGTPPMTPTPKIRPGYHPRVGGPCC
jgi:hypothetical protein